jgi:hypothetical protein
MCGVGTNVTLETTASHLKPFRTLKYPTLDIKLPFGGALFPFVASAAKAFAKELIGSVRSQSWRGRGKNRDIGLFRARKEEN